MESRSLDACSIVVDTRHLDSPPAFRSQDQRKYAVLRLYPHLRFVSRVRDSPNPQAATTPIKPSPYRLTDSGPLPERFRCRRGHPQPCAPCRFSWGWSPNDTTHPSFRIFWKLRHPDALKLSRFVLRQEYLLQQCASFLWE